MRLRASLTAALALACTLPFARGEDGADDPNDLASLEALAVKVENEAYVFSELKKFREEYEYHIREKGCWRRVAKTFEEAKAKSGTAQPAAAAT